MRNEFYTVFVSRTGRYDETALLLVETRDKNLFEKKIADAERVGFKIAKIYYPETII